ncbi:MAG: galactosyltransferase-related protein [Betaproteobacteria bacterium]
MQASAIVTYRGAPGTDRRANLDAVLAWLAGMPAIETIVVEQETHPRLEAPLAHPAARVAFAYNAGPFNKAWGLNVGARHAAGGVLLFGDADVIVPGGLTAAATHGAQSMQVVKPYRQLIDLTPEETRLVREGGGEGPLSLDVSARRDRDAIGERLALCGGWFAMRHDAFVAIGGFDERFVGWGGEDDAMTMKVELARLSTCELDPGPALHLWHPRSPESTTGHPDYRSNCALLDDYARYDEVTLARLFEVQRQTYGRRDKYRPDPR